MDIFYTAPDATGGAGVIGLWEYANGGSAVDYSFALFVPTAGQTIVHFETAIRAAEASYSSAHSYSISNRQTWYPLPATTSLAGLMSAADKTKLDGIVAQTQSAVSRSIVTGTGATGFQVSSTRNSFVNYSVTIGTTATIGGNSSGTVVLEIAPTNSATPGDWVEIGRYTNGQAISLALVLQSVQTLAGQISGMVPAGYYAKLRSINNAGTPSFTFNSGQDILL